MKEVLTINYGFSTMKKVKFIFMEKNKIFEDLFVLELANNHWGDVNRGLKIISSIALEPQSNFSSEK